MQVNSERWLRLCGLSGWCKELRLIRLGLVTILFVRNCANLHVPCELRQKSLECADDNNNNNNNHFRRGAPPAPADRKHTS